MKREAVCPIYRMPVIFCDDRKEANKAAAMLGREVERKHEPDVENDGGSVDYINGTLLFCVYDLSLDLVAHEAVHAASKTLRERGIKGDPSDDHEHLTYLVEWYFNEWIKRMKWKVRVTK